MKRWIKGSLYTIEPYISLYVFLFVLFVIGVIFGANLVGNLNFLQQQDLLFFVENYFQMLERPADQAIMDSFLNILYTHGKYMIFLFLFGLSFVGLPIVWFLLFLKGVVVGFTVGFLVHQLAWDGFFISLVSIAPQNLLIIPAYLFLAAGSMIFSIRVMRLLFSRLGNKASIGEVLRNYFKNLAISFCILLAGCVVEILISSQAIPLVIN